MNYTELSVSSNFSFLRGASHPEELAARAVELKYRAIALTDLNTLAGVVRAHGAAKEHKIQFIAGSRLSFESWKPLRGPAEAPGGEPEDLNRHTAPAAPALLVYPANRAAYGRLCTLLTLGNRRVKKGECLLTLADFLKYQEEMAVVILPSPRSTDEPQLFEFCAALKEGMKDKKLLSLALVRNYSNQNREFSESVLRCSASLGIPLVAANDVYYHIPERRPLQDVLTCIREKTTIQKAGFRLFQNGERYLKPPEEMMRLFRDIPSAIKRTGDIAELCAGFSLDQLKYEYPDAICPPGKNPLEYITELVSLGARERYPQGVPPDVEELLKNELQLIHELRYEKYFLTCYDIVKFARSRGILCQGRGAAANSAVCFCLGITSVDPARIELLFARFVSRERNEPPDIDIDFEHERREEVIQYIYAKYGREHAGLTAEVVSYRHRSAVREVAKALGLPSDTVDRLAKSIHHWARHIVDEDELKQLGLNVASGTVQNLFKLSNELLSFPRHLSQHVGGFIICQKPLIETVPVLKAAMEERTIIEWDKDDIDTLGMLKIDVLALGMLTCIRKAIDFVNAARERECSAQGARSTTEEQVFASIDRGRTKVQPPDASAASHPFPLQLHNIPPEDPAVYDMLCDADTIGVFQVESRAQMSMLPRLKPRCFYDLVIEVAIVRPGPIHGNMVHPYLKRRNGLEKVNYPDPRVEQILGKTMGVPIFQEQAMRLAITLAKFTPGEAEKLRRAMAAWKKDKTAIEVFKQRILEGMAHNGYSEQFAETCIDQLKGFSEYGFPESHAASFALLVYASAWLKRYYPAEFAAALLNSQPMGFYAPAQIIKDAQDHGIEVLPVDVNLSGWDTMPLSSSKLRLGMRLVKGVPEEQARLIGEAVKENGEFKTPTELWNAVRGRNEITTEEQAHFNQDARAANEENGISSSPRSSYEAQIPQKTAERRGNSVHDRCAHHYQPVTKVPARLESRLPFLRRRTLQLLARANAFQSMKLNSREALWEIKALPEEILPLDAFAAPVSRSKPPLPVQTAQQSMFQDYEATGLSLNGHPIGFVREYLNQRHALSAATLKARLKFFAGRTVRVGGLAIFRQRPVTAHGTIFITLEDETGILNLIVRPAVFDKYHKEVLSSSSLLARGKLDYIGRQVYISADQLESLDEEVRNLKHVKMPTRSYSY